MPFIRPAILTSSIFKLQSKISILNSQERPMYIRRIVSLEACDYRTIRKLPAEKGLGGKGFSAALRMIIR